MYAIDVGDAPEDQNIIYLETVQEVEDYYQRTSLQNVDGTAIYYDKVKLSKVPDIIKFFIVRHDKPGRYGNHWFIGHDIFYTDTELKNSAHYDNEYQRFMATVFAHNAKDAMRIAENAYDKFIGLKVAA